jgi:hypothetical protein
MFVLRSDLFALADPQSMRRAPWLSLMAFFTWSLGIATIYPPGALTIALKPYSTTETANVSVMNPPVPESFNPILAPSEANKYHTLSNGPDFMYQGHKFYIYQ